MRKKRIDLCVSRGECDKFFFGGERRGEKSHRGCRPEESLKMGKRGKVLNCAMFLKEREASVARKS